MVTTLQPELHSNPSVNIWPLIARDYSACALHITDDRRNLDISAIKAPLFLSQNTNPRNENRFPSYVFLLSTYCLLRVISLRSHNPSDFYITDQLFLLRNTNLHGLRPQAFLFLLADNGPDYSMKLALASIDERLLPEVFLINPDETLDAEDKVESFKITFLCWYCKPNSSFPFDKWLTFESSCSGESTCGSVLNSLVEQNVVDSGAPFWYWNGCDYSSSDLNYQPFRRDTKKPGRLIGTVLRFLHGGNGSIWSEYHGPEVSVAKRDELERWRAKGVYFPLAESPKLKFFTSDGVTESKTSSDVYFAPFTSQVWSALLISACITLLLEISFRAAGMKYESVLLCSIVYEFSFWKIASLVGQCSSMSPTGMSKSGRNGENLNYSRPITVTSVAWIVSTFLIITNYGAYFSAESLREFSYTTKYGHIMEMIRENFTMYYLLDERKFSLINRHPPGTTDIIYMASPNTRRACDIFRNSGQECELAHYSQQLKWYYVNAYQDCLRIADGVANRVTCLRVRKWYLMFLNLQYRLFFLRNTPAVLEKVGLASFKITTLARLLMLWRWWPFFRPGK